MVYRIVLLLSLMAIANATMSQDSLAVINDRLTSAYLNNVGSKAQNIDQKLDKYTDKTLRKALKQEERIKRKLSKIDPGKAERLFGKTVQPYQQLQNKSDKFIKLQHYIPSLDSLSTSLKFLQENENLISATKDGKKKLADAMNRLKGMESQFQKAEEVKKFLKERRQYLKEQLQNLGFGRELKKLNKQAYYYSEQFNEYKSLLKDHKKAERKVIALLSKTKLFKDFMSKNSYMASFFRLPDDPNNSLSLANISGLQTRVQVSNLVQQQIGSAGAGAQQQFQQNMQQAQNQLSQLKNKINQLSGGGNDANMPEGFKPNDQKVKSLLKRLELSVNIQTQKKNGYFPNTSDIGLSLGYKLNSKSIVGLGLSYKLGLGENIRHIKLTSQGIGIRSFVDWKIKGSLWLSGGLEMNYRSEFQNVDELKNLNAWQKSGLIGLSKVLSLKTKLFKKTKFSFLWDFLSYRQAPRTQPVVFRVGYSF